MKLTALATVAVLALAGCSSSAPAASVVAKPSVTTPTTSAPVAAAPTLKAAAVKPVAPVKVDPVAQAITDRYGDCLIKLKFVKPFDINVYQSTHKADVSGTPGVVGFRTATSNTGNLLIIPEDSDNSARALASVGC